ncbi:poly(ADP-ribose) glycohydrolase [Onychostoma macrolepis]|uniref:poly(ADP-ribose) glycohydrolase n=1 Tax=Onychostoma macrolepis TaxID=369639 RepID=UPI00272C592A|nr:poly(ADP-ribose) glycohydrolase [Onychostoma macrolepis]
MSVLEINACGVSVSRHSSYPAVLWNCHSSRFHPRAFTFVLATQAITRFYRHWTPPARTITAEQMSQQDSSQVWECFSQTNNSGNTGDQSRGEPKNQHSSTDSAGKGATSQPTSETTGNENKNPYTFRPNDNGRNEAPGKKTLSSENAEKMCKKAKSDEVQNPKPTHGASGESSSNRPSQGAPMYNSDSSSSGTRSKPGIQLGPTYPIQYLKTMQNYSTEMDKKLLGHVMIDMTCFKSGVMVPYHKSHVWDSYHVKLPHLYPRPQSYNKSHAPPTRWEATCHALRKLTKGSNSIGDVQTAIMSYNSNNKDKWTFDALYLYGQRLHSVDNNLDSLIPKMAKLALDLPDLIKQPIPLLRQQQNQAITMSQQQISSLLANAFFCTFPHRNDTKPGSEYANFPTINFSSLFANEKDSERLNQKGEKLRAIFHYFNTVTKESHDQGPAKPDGLVSFERISIPPSQLPDWNKQKMPLRNLHVSSEGSIEKEGTGMLQVDFANKYIGGGVLKSGLVQEEILFLMSPELIVARLFTEKLADNECLKITGPQMYSLSSGYSRSFFWKGPFDDCTKRDVWKRRYRQIVAIDALELKYPKDQYTKENITRELNKAFVGFHGNPKTAIATGNWGCGAFKGDHTLKALIQLMAAAVAERDMAYFTFRNKELANEIQEIHEILTKNNVTVDKLYKWLKEFCGQHAREHNSQADLYGFIKVKIGFRASLL